MWPVIHEVNRSLKIARLKQFSRIIPLDDLQRWTCFQMEYSQQHSSFFLVLPFKLKIITTCQLNSISSYLVFSIQNPQGKPQNADVKPYGLNDTVLIRPCFDLSSLVLVNRRRLRHRLLAVCSMRHSRPHLDPSSREELYSQKKSTPMTRTQVYQQLTYAANESYRCAAAAANTDGN